jgi:beta-N-acetylhexosaminidase
MSAHINMNGIENTERPATLSKYVMHTILRDSLGFDGLIFSDGMNMRGITMQFAEGDAAVEAIKAGVDVIEFVLHPELVINAIKLAVQNGEITEAVIRQKCRKVLLAKEWIGLQNYEANKVTDLNASLNSNSYKLTSRRLYEQAITVIQNKNSILPLQRLDTLKIASLSIGKENITHFQNRLNKYMEIDNYHIGLDASEVEINKLITTLKSYNLVIAGVHGTSLSNYYKIKEVHKKVVKEVCLNTNSILAFFSNPYALTQFKSLELSEALLVSYGESYWAQDYAAQIIFGAIGCDSKLPVSISKYFKEGIGYELKKNGRLKYTIPEEEGFDSKLLKIKIDSFANYGIKEKIFPGCQVLVAKNGKVIYHESYGFHTYDSITILKKDDLYDWASLTKITGPLPILMKFTEDSVLDLDKPFSSYWPDFRNTNKESITLREILAHQSGFKPWIPFYVSTLKKNNDFKKRFLRTRPSSNFPYRVASNLYIHKHYNKKMFKAITELEMSEKKYRYSGLAFYLFPDMISNITGSVYEQCLYDSFYKPLGASSVCYNPYTKFTKNIFVPTEQDDLFRKELLQGVVHDEGAAMLGGVSGNAGLFGRTNDLAKIMQFYLLGGTYGDFNYLKPETIKEFTRIQYEENENRRGLGFDKPYIDNANKKLKDAYPAIAVSKESLDILALQELLHGPILKIS